MEIGDHICEQRENVILQIALQVYLQSCLPNGEGEFNLARCNDQYRENRTDLEFKDLEDLEDLIEKRNKMHTAYVKENKRLEIDLNKLQAVSEKSAAYSQRIEILRQHLIDNEKEQTELKKVVEKNKESTFTARLLGSEERDLGRKCMEKEVGDKVDQSEVMTIQNKIQDNETWIKKETAIQKRSEDTLKILKDKQRKFHSACVAFQNNMLPCMNSLLEKIPLSPIHLAPPTNAEKFIKQMVVIEKKVEFAEQVLRRNMNSEEYVENGCVAFQSHTDSESESDDEQSKSRPRVSRQQYLEKEDVLKERIELYNFEIEELEMSLVAIQEAHKAGKSFDDEEEEHVLVHGQQNV